MRQGNSSTIVKAAIEYGCKTAKDLARFLKEYNPQVFINESGKAVVQLSY